MWETRSVFQGGFISVISTAAYGCKFSWRAIGERGLWPAVVEIVEPKGQFAASIREAEEHLHVQTFVAQPSVEALDVAVLDRSAEADEAKLYAVPGGRDLQSPGRRIRCHYR